MKTNFLIIIAGPTAIGKTALSLKLAQHFKTEIISADSRQFFKEMTIGTAVPSPTELALIKHHCIHHRSIENDYNVGAYEKDVITLLEQLFKSHNNVIMVGGSGLYIDAITKGLDTFPKIDSKIREALNQRLTIEGLESLQKQLKELDNTSYQTISIDNPHRVIRALEICIGTGKPYSSFLNKNKTTRNFTSITIGLTAERQTVYDRINQRVDLMMEQGLLDEVKSLQNSQDLNALKTVGYQELFKYLNGTWTLDFAVSEIKKNSRRYAKRQLTWFKKDESILWFDYKSEVSNVINSIKLLLSKK